MGCGCIVGLMLLALVVGVPASILYFLYDGYAVRSLSEQDTAKIESGAIIMNISDSFSRQALALRHLGPDHGEYVLVLTGIKNKSEYVIRNASVWVNLTDKAGVPMERLYSAPCQRDQQSDFRLPPNSNVIEWCAAKLTPQIATAISAERYGGYTWGFRDIDGHRLPIRLVKAPIDWVLSLFERVDE